MEISVYLVKNRGEVTAYVSRGLAVDNNKSGRVMRAKLMLDDSETLPTSGMTAIRFAKYNDGDEVKYTPYFRSDEAINAYLSNAGYDPETLQPEYQGIPLNLNHLSVPQGTMTASLQQDEQGRLFCLIQTNPDELGFRLPGKRFFPDKTWINACPGQIIIAGLREMQKYGFIYGNMINFTYTDLQAILDFLWDKAAPGTGLITYIESPGHGNYYRYESPYDDNAQRFGTDKDGNVTFLPLDENDNIDGNEYIVWEETLNNIMFNDAWNIDRAVNTEGELLRLFETCEFDEPDRRVQGEWTLSDELIDESIDKYVERGVFRVYELDGYKIKCVRLVEEMFYDLSNADRETAETIIKAAANINRKAADEIKTQVKKGRMRLQS